MKRFLFALLSLLLLQLQVVAQWHQKPATGSTPETLIDRTKLAGQSGMGASITATLVDRAANARQGRAVIQADTEGVQTVDPATQHVPALDQAHIQYQLDGAAPVSTTSHRIELGGLLPGEHHIQVSLAGNDKEPIGHPTTLSVYIPGP